MTRKYKTIVVDPPWDGPGACPTFKKGGAHINLIPYQTMSGLQIASLRIDDIAAKDAQLFLWATSRSLGDAYLLLQSWRFSFRGLLVWKKSLGLGRFVRNQTEYVVWGTRAGAKSLPPGKAIRQLHEWPRTRRHSEKPAEAYSLFSDLGDAPRIDVFARRRHDGFDAWGNEVEKGRLRDA